MENNKLFPCQYVKVHIMHVFEKCIFSQTYQRFLLIGIQPSSLVKPFKANPRIPFNTAQNTNRTIRSL